MIKNAFALPIISLLLGFTTAACGAMPDGVFRLAPEANFFHFELATPVDYTDQTKAIVAVEQIAVVPWDDTRGEFDKEALDLSLALNSEADAGPLNNVGLSELVQVPVSTMELGKVRQIEILFSVSPGDAFDLTKTGYEKPTR